ncbi:AI-2E family transporter [Bacillus sp. 03113]|uniref:AI-2E family transporter n=1 Tax=Bacillus sp. 03113 TaxID=2578211 RepID=UPI0011445901|nr:AI-2E family transporter [Bacillus sp. 03113]
MDIQVKWYYRLGFLLLLFVVLFVFIKLQQVWLPILKLIMTIISPFIIAAFITYLLHPIVEKLHQSGWNRGLSVFFIYFLFFGGVGYALYMVIPAFNLQLKELAESAPQLADQYREWTSFIEKKTANWPDGIQDRVDDGITTLEAKIDLLLSNILNWFVNLANFIILLALIPFISFYMLKDITLMKKAVWYITPRKWRREGVHFLRDVNHSLGSYIRGQLLVCVIIGTISALLFWLFHMRYPLLLGFIIGVTDVIPYYGPIIGAIPAVLISLTISFKMVIITIIIIIALQFLEGNVLSPMIVGKSLQMHPLFIMFALLVGGEVGGIIGLILAVPVLSIVKVALIHARIHFGKKSSI